MKMKNKNSKKGFVIEFAISFILIISLLCILLLTLALSMNAQKDAALNKAERRTELEAIIDSIENKTVQTGKYNYQNKSETYYVVVSESGYTYTIFQRSDNQPVMYITVDDDMNIESCVTPV